nr:MAG TPA_asm: hypothetical protein [Bacteriophage sp.]
MLAPFNSAEVCWINVHQVSHMRESQTLRFSQIS